jgi:hypothetical protein
MTPRSSGSAWTVSSFSLLIANATASWKGCLLVVARAGPVAKHRSSAETENGEVVGDPPSAAWLVGGIL